MDVRQRHKDSWQHPPGLRDLANMCHYFHHHAKTVFVQKHRRATTYGVSADHGTVDLNDFLFF